MYDPEDEEDHAHQHLLRHAPSDVRRGREQDALDERWRTGRRVAEPQDVRRDGRRGEVTRVDGAHPGHQRQRPARRRTSSRTSRSIRRRTSASAAAFYAVAPAPDGSVWGTHARLPRRGHSAEPGLESARDGAGRSLRAAVQRSEDARASRRAAATSIATACTGPRSPAATWPASIGASARAAQRTEGHRPALSRRLDALCRAAAAAARASPIRGAPKRSYYTWVDQFDTLGLGENMPINTGNASEGLLR